MSIAHYRHCPGDQEIWLILYRWWEDPNTLMADLMQLSNILSVVQNYLINARNHRDASKQQSCQNLTHLSCHVSHLIVTNEKGIPIIPDWNVFHHKAWKSVYSGARRDHPLILQFTWNNSWWGSAYCHGVWNVRAYCYCEYSDRFQQPKASTESPEIFNWTN